jgi:hypothetical protein
MSFKRIIVLALIFAFAYSELTFLQESSSISVSFIFTRKCTDFTAGDCTGLSPAASLCYRLNESDAEGYCARAKEDGGKSNKFVLP